VKPERRGKDKAGKSLIPVPNAAGVEPGFANRPKFLPAEPGRAHDISAGIAYQ
jgi:hypothetical protein